MATGSEYAIDEAFVAFAQNLAQAISTVMTGKGKKRDGEGLNDRQRRQIEELVGYEEEFRAEICRDDETRYTVYQAFISKIVRRKVDGGYGNLLEARPFFRERSIIFPQIVEAMETKDVEALAEFDFNYRFVAFVLAEFEWPKRHKLRVIAKNIKRIRDALIVENTPLAISRAKIYWHHNKAKAPSAHLTYMDLVQIAAEGLISAVDKFAPYHPRAAFRSTIMGRMHGNFNKEGSQTLVHFYPKDARKRYRALKDIAGTVGGLDYEKIAKVVNIDLPKNARTTSSEIALLLAAESDITSMDATDASDDGRERPLFQYADSTDKQPESMFEKAEIRFLLKQKITELVLFEQKLLRMRGVR